MNNKKYIFNIGLFQLVGLLLSYACVFMELLFESGDVATFIILGIVFLASLLLLVLPICMFILSIYAYNRNNDTLLITYTILEPIYCAILSIAYVVIMLVFSFSREVFGTLFKIITTVSMFPLVEIGIAVYVIVKGVKVHKQNTQIKA